MKIIYLERKGTRWSYYKDMVTFLGKYCDLKLCSDNFTSEIDEFQPDAIIVGFSFTSGNDRHRDINLNTSVPTFVILNKEYDRLDDKLQWIQQLRPKKFFTVHHDFLGFQKTTGITCERIMWSADHRVFRPYDREFRHDLVFSGVVRPKQTGNIHFPVNETRLSFCR